MLILKCISSSTFKDPINNTNILYKLDVAAVEDKIKGTY